MEIVDYFLYKNRVILYSFISMVISSIISCIVNYSFFKLFILLLLEIFILRVFDDINDYEIDILRKKYIVKKDNLKYILFVISVIFLGFNILFFKYKGILSIFLILYIYIQNKYVFFKKYFSFISFWYYFYATKGFDINVISIIFSIFILLLTFVYGLFKE